MCHAAVSQNRSTRGCSVVMCRNNNNIRPHSVRSHADVCLNEKRVGDDRSKPAQGGDETELPKFFAKIEIKFDAAEMFLSMKRRQVALDRQFERAEHNQNRQRDEDPHHNSFP